jgi:branched-chain amino acid transport system permease protein
VIGAAILVPLSEFTRIKLGEKGTGVDLMIYGALITIISVYQPKGVWGFIRSVGARRAPSLPPVVVPGPP